MAEESKSIVECLTPEALEEKLETALPDPGMRALVKNLLGKKGLKETGIKLDEILSMATKLLEGRKEGDDGIDMGASAIELLKQRLGVGNAVSDEEIPILQALEGVDVHDSAALKKAVVGMAQAEGAEKVLKRLIPVQTYRKTEPVVGRNERCPCGSGKKFKSCCMRKQK